jgi:hypothetical protein
MDTSTILKRFEIEPRLSTLVIQSFHSPGRPDNTRRTHH